MHQAFRALGLKWALSQGNFLKNTVLAFAEAWLESTLSVISVNGSLLLDGISLSHTLATSLPTPPLFIPSPHSPVPVLTHSMHSGADPSCGFSGGITIPTVYLDNAPSPTGMPNTDMVLFATARPTTGTVIAYAGNCKEDQFGRPLAGHMNFGPNKVRHIRAPSSLSNGQCLRSLCLRRICKCNVG